MRAIRTEDSPIDSNLTYSNLLYNRFNQPVTGINYYEAQAYCSWLNWQEKFRDKFIIRMPTQTEWMSAMTNYGTSKYPWGEALPSPAIVNLINERKKNKDKLDLEDLAKINIPSIYGIHPNGSNNNGVHDLIGNIWEWVEDFAKDHEIDDKGNKGKIMGNCCFDPPSRVEYPPLTYRYPGYRHHVIGFRLVREEIR